jgi:dihydrofolate reductase
MARVLVSLVAAVAANHVIGAGGKLPWRLSSDMKRFRRLTMGKPLIMGRKTFETIGKPLDGRLNIVVSRQPAFRATGITLASSFQDAIRIGEERANAAGGVEVMVIGGGEIYTAALPIADRLYITHVDSAPDGDTRFPAIDLGIWRAMTTEPLPAGDKDSAATSFVVYERRTPDRDAG